MPESTNADLIFQVKIKGHSDDEDRTSQDSGGQKSKKAKTSAAKRRKAPNKPAKAAAAPKAKLSHEQLDEEGGHAEPLVKASDESVDGVRAQLTNGCECAEASCFDGLCPEAVYRYQKA